jgi:hypothetical protein
VAVAVNPDLDALAKDLRTVIDGAAGMFGSGARPTIDGDLDCDPVNPGKLVCRQYGVRLEAPDSAESSLPTVVRSFAGTGWKAVDRGTAGEFIVQFSREGANVNVHVARDSGAVAIVGSTRCVPGSA